jgi:hypothetical protein
MHWYVLSGRVFHRPAKAVVLEAVFHPRDSIVLAHESCAPRPANVSAKFFKVEQARDGPRSVQDSRSREYLASA